LGTLPETVTEASGASERPIFWVKPRIAVLTVTVGLPSAAFLVMKLTVPPVAPAP
jgi:hypothetical protein